VDLLGRRCRESDPRHLQAGPAQFALNLGGNVWIVERISRVGDKDRVTAPGTQNRGKVGDASRCKK
jgi:hypothetical protein